MGFRQLSRLLRQRFSRLEAGLVHTDVYQVCVDLYDGDLVIGDRYPNGSDARRVSRIFLM